MKRLFVLAAWAFLGMQAVATPAQAAIDNGPVDSADYITIGGLDWAWASPCNPFAPTCGAIDLSVQGPLGWALASTSQIDDAIAAAGGLTGWVNQFQPGGICASRYFSNSWTNCDYSDALSGLIYNYSGNVEGAPGGIYELYNETFTVREHVGVPAPDGLPLFMIGLGLVLFGAYRRASGHA